MSRSAFPLDAFDASFPRVLSAGSGGRCWPRFGGGIGVLMRVGAKGKVRRDEEEIEEMEVDEAFESDAQ